MTSLLVAPYLLFLYVTWPLGQPLRKPAPPWGQWGKDAKEAVPRVDPCPGRSRDTMGRGESCTTTGVRRTVAGPFQLGASTWEQVWLRGYVKAQNLGPGHPQTCSTHSLPHLIHWATPSFQQPEHHSHLGLHLQSVSGEASHSSWGELPSRLPQGYLPPPPSPTPASFQLNSQRGPFKSHILPILCSKPSTMFHGSWVLKPHPCWGLEDLLPCDLPSPL